MARYSSTFHESARLSLTPDPCSIAKEDDADAHVAMLAAAAIAAPQGITVRRRPGTSMADLVKGEEVVGRVFRDAAMALNRPDDVRGPLPGGFRFEVERQAIGKPVAMTDSDRGLAVAVSRSLSKATTTITKARVREDDRFEHADGYAIGSRMAAYLNAERGYAN